jgi:hypothetical protein
MRLAAATSVAPQARKNSVAPPNVAAPNDRSGTLNPDAPSRRYSILAPKNWKLLISRRSNAEHRHTAFITWACELEIIAITELAILLAIFTIFSLIGSGQIIRILINFH